MTPIGAVLVLATALPPLFGWLGIDERPILSGPVETLATDDGAFVVHFTRDGTDAIPASDMPARVLGALEDARDAFAADGWRALAADMDGGGTPGIDLYIRGVDINGYAHGVAIDGEAGRGSCWMEVEADLGSVGGDVLESVVAHELHHCVQYRYTWDAASWLHEATSTWVQYRSYTSGLLTIALSALYATRLAEPWRAIDDRTGRYEYAAFVFVKFWTERDGVDPDRAVALWEALAVDPDWRETLDAESQRVFDQPFDATALDYATWNGFACARDDGAHYVDDALACTADLSVPVAPLDEASFTLSLAEGSYATAYGALPGGDGRPVSVRCEAPGAPAAVRLVSVTADGTGTHAAEAFTEGDLPLQAALPAAVDPDGEILVVAVATGRPAVELVCEAARIDVIAEEPAACGCATGSRGGVLWLPLVWLVRRRR